MADRTARGRGCPPPSSRRCGPTTRARDTGRGTARRARAPTTRRAAAPSYSPVYIPATTIRPPRRTTSSAEANASGCPTASITTSAPRSSVRSARAISGSCSSMFTGSAPASSAMRRRAGSRSRATTRSAPVATNAWTASGPTGPRPSTATVPPGPGPQRRRGDRRARDVAQEHRPVVVERIVHAQQVRVRMRHADALGLHPGESAAEEPTPEDLRGAAQGGLAAFAEPAGAAARVERHDHAIPG